MEDPIVMQVQLLQRCQVIKFSSIYLLQPVVFKVEYFQLAEPSECLPSNSNNLTSVQEQTSHSRPSDERRLNKVSEVIAIKIYGSCIHRNKWWNMHMISVRADNGIMCPCGVMCTAAPVRALHAAVTSKEITALTQSKAVSLVFTQELAC